MAGGSKTRRLSADDHDKQRTPLITFTENAYTNAVDQPDDYRTPLPWTSRTYELRKILPPVQPAPGSDELPITRLLPFPEKPDEFGHVFEVLYEDLEGSQAPAGSAFRRLIEQARTLYRKNDLTGLLDPGKLESMALPGESYKLAFTPVCWRGSTGGRSTSSSRQAHRRPEELLPDPGGVLRRHRARPGRLC